MLLQVLDRGWQKESREALQMSRIGIDCADEVTTGMQLMHGARTPTDTV